MLILMNMMSWRFLYSLGSTCSARTIVTTHRSPLQCVSYAYLHHVMVLHSLTTHPCIKAGLVELKYHHRHSPSIISSKMQFSNKLSALSLSVVAALTLVSNGSPTGSGVRRATLSTAFMY